VSRWAQHEDGAGDGDNQKRRASQHGKEKMPVHD
jgi:hypothetical protein